MEKIDQRFELLLTTQERKALEKLAVHEGVSMGSVLRNALRCHAKRKKVWQ